VWKKWRRTWLAVALACTAFAVVVVHLVVDQVTREPPNYTRIENGLWLGGYVAEPPSGTQAVLNLCETEDPYRVETHKWEPIRDAEPAPSLEWLRQQVGFIESERAAGHVVFVHCRNGVSRSGMVMAAFFMRREKWSLDQSLEFLRSRRPGVRPNPAFMRLLLEWEQSLKE
jgi:Dual specificity phosphatase, catalytic domain